MASGGDPSRDHLGGGGAAMMYLPDSPRATEEMIQELLHGGGLPDFVAVLSSPPGETDDRPAGVQVAPATSLRVDFQPQAEGTIDPAHMNRSIRLLWRMLMKSLHLCPPEPDLIPGLGLNPFDDDWGLLERLPCGSLSLLPRPPPSNLGASL